MKTSLHFEAPSDLSVGTVRIEGDGQAIADWVATPDNRTFLQEDVEPGVYSCVVTPAGLAPQSVYFEVREGVANTVILPSFSALSSSGSNTNFFDADTQQAFSDVLGAASRNIFEKLNAQKIEVFDDAASETYFSSNASRVIHFSDGRKRISIGLSEESRGRESFDLYQGQSKLNLSAGRLEIELPEDIDRDPWAGDRVRLSAAIEQLRVERCLLPLYCGGTKITVAVPAFSPADLELVIMPIDPKQRALVRTLDAGTSAEVIAIRDDIIGNVDPLTLLADHADPWAAILVGLISIRFPEHFTRINLQWADALVGRASWAFDAHVICAKYRLIEASIASSNHDDIQAAQDLAVSESIASLAKAQVAGSPYYSNTNSLFAEIAGGISDYLKKDGVRLDPSVVKKFDRLFDRWHRELPLQRGAGSTFTWLARDPVALKDHVLAPKRNSSGTLRRRDSSIIFEGQVSAGQIALFGGSTNVTSTMKKDVPDSSTSDDGYSLMPALLRAPGPEDDPNQGRFGGQASRDGYFLSATFEPTLKRNWVTINLVLETDSSTNVGLGDFAWFVLHPTFSPTALKVAFGGNRAKLQLRAWGGFTVGVWIPKVGVELECNLAKIEDAPRIIKTR